MHNSTWQQQEIPKLSRQQEKKFILPSQIKRHWNFGSHLTIMTGKIHDFDLKVGGGYSMSLFYLDKETAGKTSGNEDRFSAKFIELEPFEKIVQTIHFQSDKKEFTNEMIMKVLLTESENNSTKVTIIFENIPTGIDPKDNEAGTEQSLEKLAYYIDSN